MSDNEAGITDTAEPAVLAPILHVVHSVAATAEAGVYALMIDATDVNGERHDGVLFVARPDDAFGLGPTVQGWLAEHLSSVSVTAYTPPTEAEMRAAMQPLEKWRVDTIIDLQPGLRDAINAAIDAMPDPARTINRNKLLSATMFERADPLFDALGTSVGMTAAQIDELWTDAAAL